MEQPTIRLARPDEFRAIAELHVRTFGETHGWLGAPSLALRESQWEAALTHPQDHEFCLVVQSSEAILGFARGMPYRDREHGEFKGLLDKIYLLKAYHRTGLGRRLLARVASEFLARGIDSMLMFGDAGSSTNGFYEAMGGERLFAANGEFHGGYGWRDLRRLADGGPPFKPSQSS